MKVILELDPIHAAALKRFAEKVSFSEARAITYGDHSKEQRDARAYEVIAAFSKLEDALADAGARGWPWVETGKPS